MQTTATTQVTSDISSEPVGKAERRKKLKIVATQLTVYSSFADGNHYNGEIQILQPLVDRMTTVPLAERLGLLTGSRIVQIGGRIIFSETDNEIPVSVSNRNPPKSRLVFEIPNPPSFG